MAIKEIGPLSGSVISPISGFCVDFVRDWKQVAAVWSRASRSTAFEHTHWLEARYGAFESLRLLIAVVTNRLTDLRVALVPLVHRVYGGIRTIEFGDLDITEYDAPALSQGIALNDAQTQELCEALIPALRKIPESADLVKVRKMPTHIDGSVGEALKVLDVMNVQHRARMQRLGLKFVLSHEE
jgi:CelD/BcsL family acetyltransferase involved in cellulose biosynthesis